MASSMDSTSCPECGALAEVEWRAVLESTDGPVEHAKVRCVTGHWFLLPVASLVAPAPERATPTVTRGRGAEQHCHRLTASRGTAGSPQIQITGFCPVRSAAAWSG